MKKSWSKIPPAVVRKEKSRAIIYTGLGCFVPLGLLFLLAFPAAYAIRAGMPLMFLGISVSIVGLLQYGEAKKIA